MTEQQLREKHKQIIANSKNLNKNDTATYAIKVMDMMTDVIQIERDLTDIERNKAQAARLLINLLVEKSNQIQPTSSSEAKDIYVQDMIDLIKRLHTVIHNMH